MFSPLYRMMCREAFEIQSLWKPVTGDWMLLPEKFCKYYQVEQLPQIVCCCVELEKVKEKPLGTATWLPTQSQLQNIMRNHIQAPDLGFIIEFQHWMEDEIKLWESPQTMEELWITYIYQKIYNKQWKGETWE